MIFLGKIVSYLLPFGQGEDFKLTTELSEKVQYPHNKAIKNESNEAILLIWKKLYVQDKILCVSSNQDLICKKGIWIFNAQLVKIPQFKSLLTRKQARWTHLFIAFF